MSTIFSQFDHLMMSQALKLAKRGIYTTAPNPRVGCVITQGNDIIGQGFHFRAGEPHAEVHALREAGTKAKGATAYVTLEPCSHYGRTPPCAKALTEAGVSRVVCAMTDPNPQVAGNGFRMLRDAGIQVDVGLLESEALALNPGFISAMKHKRPFVQLKLAASLDGQTALSNGESKWITGSEARRDVQRFRAMSGAILSTSQTVITDDASLNVRWDELPNSVQQIYSQEALRQPTRVILDRQSKLSSELKLFATDGETIVISGQGEQDHLLDGDKIALSHLLTHLTSEHGINHLWVEAGATLATSMIQEKLVDELILYVAPKLMGQGRSLIESLGLDAMDQVIDLEFLDVRMIGKDIRIIAKPVWQ